MSEFTQVGRADGAVILKDGVMLTIEEIIELLRQGDKLMGAGEEPVAWRYWNEKSKSWNETHSKLVAEAMGEGGRKVEPLYTQAPTVDGAVLQSCAECGPVDDGTALYCVRCIDRMQEQAPRQVPTSERVKIAESVAAEIRDAMVDAPLYGVSDISHVLGVIDNYIAGLVRPAEPATQRKWTGPGELERSGYIDPAEPDGGAA
jgi:hypothetical protein